MQGIEQVVCQLLIATLCRKSGMKWHGIAVKAGKTARFESRQRVEWPERFDLHVVDWGKLSLRGFVFCGPGLAETFG
jgi:hypothetical protein